MGKYNKEKFTELLDLAIGSRTKKDFAKISGIPATHLSRMVSASCDSVPSTDTLLKIAAHAENNVTYDELLDACGRRNAKEEAISPEMFMKMTIFSFLESLNIPFTIETETDIACDLFISLCPTRDTKNRWYFKFLSSNTTNLSSSYQDLLFYDFTPDDKYSFVTLSEKTYDIVIEKPVNLNTNLSILLAYQFEIIKEGWLSKAVTGNTGIDYLSIKNS